MSLIILAACAVAQEAAPKYEVYGGYSLLHTPGGVPQSAWTAAGTRNFNYRWGVTAELTGVYYNDSTAYPSGIRLHEHGSNHHYLFGPTYSLRDHSFTRFHFTPSLHSLFGLTHITRHDTYSGAVPTFRTSSGQTQFAMALGGAFDVPLKGRISLRPVQADYLMYGFGGPTINRFRYSGGVVFRFNGGW